MILYVCGVLKRFFFVFKKHSLKLVYSCQNKLDKIIRTGKDVLEQCLVVVSFTELTTMIVTRLM